jgi:dephospho-CoA kinase
VILDKNYKIHKTSLRKKISSSSSNIAWLNRLMHPIIRKKVYSRATKSPYAIIEIALLNFRNIQLYFYLRKVITIVTNYAEKNKRIRVRNKRGNDLIQDLGVNQTNNNEKTNFSHYIIYNTTKRLQIKTMSKVLIKAVF